MSLNSALSIATGGLAVVQRQIAVVSQNVANASTAGYTREIGTQVSVSAEGDPSGVASGVTTRVLDRTLQGSVLSQNGQVASLTTQSAALSAIDAVQGSAGADGSSLSTLVSGLQDAFTTLQQDPSSQPQQQAVVGAAQSLASGINALSGAVTTQRQAAQDAIAQQVPQINAALNTIGTLSDQIIHLQAQGQSTADLEDQRDEQLTTLSSLVSVKATEQPNGDMTIATQTGTMLPTRDATGPLSTQDATLGASDAWPGVGVPGIMLGKTDITASLTGGSVGASIALRDTTLPTMQAELDSFSQTLASRMDAQGVRLFTDASGNVPASGSGSAKQDGYLGFAGTIQVNPAVVSNPSLVRDGTGSTTGGSSANTAGSAGFTGEIDKVLTYGFGTQQSAGVAQPASDTTGLGVTGTLSAPYDGSGTLVDIANNLTAAQSQSSAAASAALKTQTGVQTTLQASLDSSSGVSVDQELSNMVTLQNAYGANAKIVSAVQSMFNALLDAVNP